MGRVKGTVLAIVPARGGSVGVPQKNLREVGGLPLVARAIQTAQRTPDVDTVLLSSDDPQILRVGESHGAVVEHREPDLSGPEATTVEVALDILTRHEAELVAIIQPTAPFLRPETVERALELVRAGAPAAMSVTALDHPVAWTLELGPEDRIRPLTEEAWGAPRRQQHATTYRPSGGVYAIRADVLIAEGALYPDGARGVPVSRAEGLDIDEEIDLTFARAVEAAEGAPQELVVFGAGGHARAVTDVIRRRGGSIAAYVAPETHDLTGPVISSDEEGIDLARRNDHPAAVAIGDNARRIGVLEELRSAGLSPIAIVATTATVGDGVILGEATVVLEHAHVGPGAHLGDACIVNTSATVEHDVRLGEGCHVAPGAVLGGEVRCGDHVLVGLGARVAPGVTVGDGAVIGAGAVVVRPVEARTTVAGNPARRIDPQPS